MTRARWSSWKKFYHNLVIGQSASESLNHAMKCLRESERFCDVKYWAPFTLIYWRWRHSSTNKKKSETQETDSWSDLMLVFLWPLFRQIYLFVGDVNENMISPKVIHGFNNTKQYPSLPDKRQITATWETSSLRKQTICFKIYSIKVYLMYYVLFKFLQKWRTNIEFVIVPQNV